MWFLYKRPLWPNCAFFFLQKRSGRSWSLGNWRDSPFDFLSTRVRRWYWEDTKTGKLDLYQQHIYHACTGTLHPAPSPPNVPARKMTQYSSQWIEPRTITVSCLRLNFVFEIDYLRAMFVCSLHFLTDYLISHSDSAVQKNLVLGAEHVGWSVDIHPQKIFKLLNL